MNNNSVKHEVLSWLKTILVALTIVIVCRHYLITPSIVEGESMMPTLHDGDRIILSKIGKIERFDEIAFQAPDSDDAYVKRVIGLPGDKIEVKEDILYINDKQVEEPYLEEYKKSLSQSQYLTNNFTLKEVAGKSIVPEGCLFVLGDNRLVSKDSRYFGFIEDDSVIGDVKLRIWPLKAIGIPE
ncbi:signal peptidase I [Sediminibacillus dalangtanensis]|uniref:Signal peptidase I n=1 Tax=Sediminibacillus dalangtanensis TaxID=2729421 RepID=A0ABX7VMI9_9BACI|nr:signal peptidase I [Sediminibacillus dalangtanensis]QTM98027.1 signal peptidase I [Sediminibacillus dalangtanensis]